MRPLLRAHAQHMIPPGVVVRADLARLCRAPRAAARGGAGWAPPPPFCSSRRWPGRPPSSPGCIIQRRCLAVVPASKQQGSPQQQQQQQDLDEGDLDAAFEEGEEGEWGEEEDDIILLDDADEGGPYGEDDLGFDDDDDDDGFVDLDDADDESEARRLLQEDDLGPGLVTTGVPWGEAALRVAEEVLAAPPLRGIELYRFAVVAATRQVEVRLDKLDDLYGSPSIDDIEAFSRRFLAGLEAAVGPEVAGDVSLEVSSPGAERPLQLPDDLRRFHTLPLRVEYAVDGAAAPPAVLQLLELDEDAGTSVWALADVRANAPTKGRGLSKKQRQQRLAIPLADISRARIHVDF